MKSIDVESTTPIEDELLLCCCRVAPRPDVSVRLEELLQQPVNWRRLLERSGWHRIRPLTNAHLRTLESPLVPEFVLQELGDQANELAEQNLRLSKTLDEVTALFEDAGIRLLVFKGPSLTRDAYGKLNLRECGDLDFLLRRDDFERAADLVESQGFIGRWDRSVGSRQVFASEFERRDIKLDLHWDLAPRWLNYRVDFDKLWESGLPFAVGSTSVRKLCPENLLIVLCIHGAKHYWERLRWICDIAELINSGRITDWELLEAEAARTNTRRSVNLGLWLASDLLQTRLPVEAQQMLEQTPVVKRLGAHVRLWLGHAEHAQELRELKDRFFFRMGLCDRVRDWAPGIAHYLRRGPKVGD